MKQTRTGFTLLALLIALSFGLLAQSTPTAPAEQSATPAAKSTSTTTAPDQAAAYYHFAMAHIYEEMVAMYGKSEYANKAIDEYRLAIENDKVKGSGVERTDNCIVGRRLSPLHGAPVSRGAHRKAHVFSHVAIVAIDQNSRCRRRWSGLFVRHHITHAGHSRTATAPASATFGTWLAGASDNGTHQGTRTQ